MWIDFWHNNAYDTITLHTENTKQIASWTVDDCLMCDLVTTIRGNVPPSEWTERALGNPNDWRPDHKIDALVATYIQSGELIVHRPEIWEGRLRHYHIAETTKPRSNPKGCIVAVEEILRVLYECRGCTRFTCDDQTLAADSAVDAIDAIDSILRNQDLVPDEQTHLADCDI